ncbi:YkoP family protein [Oceanobacillus saliphilus]|uniref:YkoP family protein n=1 Tax=Oceanobacillus saliphilus TaxID=2925834 RepID=UPI00201E4959|nr:hypothetical protein [Oceanobacillus saliphilus]
MMKMNLRSCCLCVWNFIDPIYYRFTRLEYIVNEKGNQTMVRVRLTKYKGRSITLADGTVINKNDTLLKIHLHNVQLVKQVHMFESELRRGLVIYKSVRDALPSIAKYIQLHENTDDIKGIIGITSLYKGCKRLGFETKPIHSNYYKFFKKAAFYPIDFIASATNSKNQKTPVYLFMPKDQLYRKYKPV